LRQKNSLQSLAKLFYDSWIQYTVSQKERHPTLVHIRQILTNFKNSYTGVLSRKIAINIIEKSTTPQACRLIVDKFEQFLISRSYCSVSTRGWTIGHVPQ